MPAEHPPAPARARPRPPVPRRCTPRFIPNGPWSPPQGQPASRQVRDPRDLAGNAGCMDGDRTDFFVSHAGADRAWAEWVAWQLTEAGYSVELDVWDWAAGQNFVTKMNDALGRASRVVALFSAA